MTSLHALVTALIRLLGLYYFISAVDSLAAFIGFYVLQLNSVSGMLEGGGLPGPWTFVVTVIAFYFALSLALFFLAPPIAKILIGVEPGSTGSSEKDRNFEIPWHETLILCSGIFISAWGFVRLTDLTVPLWRAAKDEAGIFQLDAETLVYLFLTVALMMAGLILIAKFHRVSQWMQKRRSASQSETDTSISP